jgi:hypothetical protein
LGRISHAWQDFYAHAVAATGPLLPVWGAGLNPGDPDVPGVDIKPPSFYWPSGGEHGLNGEPAEKDGTTGEASRKMDSIYFVTGKYATYLPIWDNACRCFCEGLLD